MGKQQLTDAITTCVEKGQKAFIPYIMAGDGGIETLRPTILHLQELGVTAIELGIPFSDPVADGPVIQEAGERALAAGVTLRLVMEEVTKMNQQQELSVPLVFMTYLNPILRYGIEEFTADCEVAGISGAIIPDLPFEESELVRESFTSHQLALVPLISLTSPLKRIRAIAEAAEGFIYAVTVNGITGERTSFAADLATHFAQLRKESAVPVLAGFGISTPEQVKQLAALGDGVIVGSTIVKALHEKRWTAIAQLVAATK